MRHICQVCGREFDGHPSAKNCSIRCMQRGKHIRRQQRQHSTYTATVSDSPYQYILDSVDAETLSRIYADVQTHVYPKDIRINGPLPPNVARPPDIHLTLAPDHTLIYHTSRELVLE